MNQKLLQTKHTKIQINQPSIRPRVRSVFQEVTNLEFSFIQQDKAVDKEQLKKPFMYKRRNALVPVPKEMKSIQVDFLPTLSPNKCQIPPVHHEISSTLNFYNQYSKELREFETQININGKKDNFKIDQHDFSELELEQALDWMIFQMQKFLKVTYESLFTAIELVYSYLANTFHKEFRDLELITGCCIYLSSKLVDLCPIYYEDLVIQVLERKFDIDEIIKQERLICQTLCFNLIIHTPLQIAYRILQDIRDTLYLFYERGQIEILTRLIIHNLLFIELGYKFREESMIYKVVSTILLTLIENKIDKRVVNY